MRTGTNRPSMALDVYTARGVCYSLAEGTLQLVPAAP